ncbi:F-box/LRR-repeat protein At3g59190-like [Rosa chinensis]|uniref:F-box/LRR-repeat protein At3g59190-like n=1 Tax=Rosa chinensis TaxID=74649 RepID=UPI000D094A52|nr:F-box/LRR-repeat protein At3g59190-like [Rosa chinensis]
MNCKRIESTRFCDLPDEVLEHILSFLTIEDLARVGCVSKRYSKLHPSTQSLSLDESTDASIFTCDQRKRLLGSWERVLIRRGCNKLQCFRFSWCYHDHDEGKPESCCPKDLNSWMVKFIDNVVRCNVEELHLKINQRITQAAYVEFPVGRCKSLKHLSVKGMKTNIKTPLSSASFSNLERLELTLVCIPDEGIFKWISHSCKCIKELRLEDLYGFQNKSATIESPSLKSFTFILNKDYNLSNYNLYVTCEKLEDACILLGKPCSTGKYGGALLFSAPSLKNLKWTGHVMMFQNLSEVMSLEKAEIELDPGVKFDDVFNLFHGIRSVKVLDLSERTMKCLCEGDLTAEQLQLHNVCCLRIRGLSLMDDDVHAMVSLLKRMPNLATLRIEAGRTGSRYRSSSYGNMSIWELQKLALHNLKEVTIQLSSGNNGISFTQYLLHHGLQLQKMVIYYLPEQSYEVRRHKWPRTTNAKVVFHVREDKYESIDNVFDLLDRDVYPSEQILIQRYDPIAKV